MKYIVFVNTIYKKQILYVIIIVQIILNVNIFHKKFKNKKFFLFCARIILKALVILKKTIYNVKESILKRGCA